MSGTRTITNTAFSMNGKYIYDDNRPGFLYDGYDGTFILDTDTNGNTGKVGGTRCVRDVR